MKFYVIEAVEQYCYNIGANSKEEAMEKFNQDFITPSTICARIVREETFEERLSRLTCEHEEQK